MESLLILSTILFFAIAIYRKFLAPIIRGEALGDMDEQDDSSYHYEAPEINPTTGHMMFNSCVDTGGKAYGQL